MSSATEHLRPEQSCAVEEFARTAGLQESEVRELMQYQLLAPGALDMAHALALREAVRLKRDFDLDLFTTGLLAGYIERIEELEAKLRKLQAERPGRTVYSEVSFTSVAVRRG
jgi:chaperone modulatory protein CbpM